MPIGDLTAAPATDSPPMRFGPVIDGYLIPDNVPAIYATGTPHDVPMLTGFNADEASAFPGYGKMTAEAFRETARDRYGASAETFLTLYPAGTDEEAGNAQKASQRDVATVAVGRLAAERAHTAKNGCLYLYYFERGIPWRRSVRSSARFTQPRYRTSLTTSGCWTGPGNPWTGNSPT